ncbi:unnamed protein product, partial [Trichogramma brassicae]
MYIIQHSKKYNTHCDINRCWISAHDPKTLHRMHKGMASRSWQIVAWMCINIIRPHHIMLTGTIFFCLTVRCVVNDFSSTRVARAHRRVCLVAAVKFGRRPSPIGQCKSDYYNNIRGRACCANDRIVSSRANAKKKKGNRYLCSRNGRRSARLIQAEHRVLDPQIQANLTKLSSIHLRSFSNQKIQFYKMMSKLAEAGTTGHGIGSGHTTGSIATMRLQRRLGDALASQPGYATTGGIMFCHWALALRNMQLPSTIYIMFTICHLYERRVRRQLGLDTPVFRPVIYHLRQSLWLKNDVQLNLIFCHCLLSSLSRYHVA